MNSFNPTVPPTDREIQEAVEKIATSLKSIEREELLKYLLRIYRENPDAEPDCYMVVMGFASHMEGQSTPPKKRPKNLKKYARLYRAYSTGRTQASSLRHALKDCYRELGVPVEPSPAEIVAAIEKGRAEPVVHIAISTGRSSGYRPSITWSYRPFTPKELADRGLSPEHQSYQSVKPDHSEVRCTDMGTNAQGIRYLADRIPFATHVEDTVVRWNLTESLYQGEDFKEFKKALRESKAKVVEITGPMKDNAYLQAVKEVFSDLTKEKQLTCFQLHHTAPIMNFVILKYEDKPSEVLFGWGTQHGDDTPGDTKVFRSDDERLVNEFQRLFKVLQSKKFSARINVTAPTFMKTHHEKCDVLATFKEIPRWLLCELIENKECELVRIGIPGSTELGDTAISTALEKAIQRNVSVQILLAHPDCRFLKFRSSKKDNGLSKLVLDNLEKLRQLATHGPLEVKLTSDAMSVAYYQVDTMVIFSPLWSRISASEGHHFVIYSTSDTGRFLSEKQFERWWENAQTYNTSTGVIDPVQE